MNWPDQQLANGRLKNSATNSRYQKFVRVLKRTENELVRLGKISDKPSYFMECLVWNIPDTTLMRGDKLSQAFFLTLADLWNGLDGDAPIGASWHEPNEMKMLFRDDAKWTTLDGRELVLQRQSRRVVGC
ncbi:hypothetical protein [Pseudonocardia sp.]|uniref:hypothetical protein n=1 Tax=Pseudonocardia sp. TaxID=60912 RepID=UPI003D0F12EE